MESDSSSLNNPVSSDQSILAAKQAQLSSSSVPRKPEIAPEGSTENEAPVVITEPPQPKDTARPAIKRNPSLPIVLFRPPARRRWSKYVFFVQLALISNLNTAVIVRGSLIYENHLFLAANWFPPLLTATLAAGISSFAWLWLTLHSPGCILKVAFCLSPLLTCGLGAMFIYIKSVTSLVLGIILIIFGVGQFFYGCWVRSGLSYGRGAIQRATQHVPLKIPCLVRLTILWAVLYSCILVCGIGWATAIKGKPDIPFIVLVFFSLTWTMHVAKNSVQILVACLKYTHFTTGSDGILSVTIFDMITNKMGTITFVSLLTLASELLQGFTQVFKFISCGSHGFCSCVQSYLAVAESLIGRANWWGLVHVGIYRKDFIQALADTWASFEAAEMGRVIDTDLTGTFCFFCGLTGGAAAALVAGSWALAIQRSYAIELSIYAFIIGYFTCQIAMAWPQASIAADYVAYANDEMWREVNSNLTQRIQELRARSD